MDDPPIDDNELDNPPMPRRGPGVTTGPGEPLPHPAPTDDAVAQEDTDESFEASREQGLRAASKVHGEPDAPSHRRLAP